MSWNSYGTADSRVPEHTKREWQIIKIPAPPAQDILTYARWPDGRPQATLETVEVTKYGMTVFTLVNAMEVAHSRRARPLKKNEAKKLRKMVKDALRGKITCDGKLNDLFKYLYI